MKLFLVRHGETEENSAGILTGQEPGVLTEKGKAQAQQVATVLKEYHFDHIYSSDLKRTTDSAKYIKEFHLDTPLTLSKEIRERNLGVFQGQKWDSVNWDSLPGDVDTRKPEGGESQFELRTRVLNFIEQLYKEYPDGSILFVTSNGVIKHVLAHFMQIPVEQIDKVSHAHVIQIEVEKGLVGRVLNL